MNNKILIIFTLLVICSPQLLAEDDNNIVISNLETVYKFKAGKSGQLESAKTSTREEYKANEYDSQAISYTTYGEQVTVDKASSPGVKPVYSQMIGEGIFYEDHRVCVMKVPVKVGKSTVVEYERTMCDPAQICGIPISKIYDIESYLLTVELPKPLAETLVLTPQHFPEDAEIHKAVNPDGSMTYTYRLNNLKKIEQEDLSPSPSLTIPTIVITGYFDGVQGLYDYLKGFTEDGVPSEEVKALATELTAGLTDPIDKMDAITGWVRNNIRYVAIEHGEYGHRPETASAVLTNRYGDCKGTANLIKTMLKCVGLDGRLVWIGTKDEIDYTWEEYPILGSGNHMIAACMLPDSIVYLDGTVTYSPKGYIPRSIRGQSALIEDGETYMLRTVPDMPITVDTDSLAATYTIDQDFTLHGQTEHRLGGHFAIMYDNYYNSLKAEKRDRFIQRVVRQDRNSMNIHDAQYTRETPTSEYAWLRATISDDKAVKRTGGRAMVSIPIMGIDYLQTIDAESRVNPLSLPMNERYVSNVTVDLGDKASTLEMPKDSEIDNRWFDGYVRYNLDGNILTITAEVKIKETVATLDQTKEWNDAVRQVKRAISPVLKFKTSG